MLGQKEEGGGVTSFVLFSFGGGRGRRVYFDMVNRDRHPPFNFGGGGDIPRCMLLTGEISCFVLYIISVIC